MKIVIDTSILIRAFAREEGLAAEILRAINAAEHTLILSNEILAEVSDVLRRPHVQRLHTLGEADVYNFIETLREKANVVKLDPATAVHIRDVNDADVLRAAIAGAAEVICAYDRDFFEEPAASFLAERGIEVLDDVGLLRRLRQ